MPETPWFNLMQIFTIPLKIKRLHIVKNRVTNLSAARISPHSGKDSYKSGAQILTSVEGAFLIPYFASVTARRMWRRPFAPAETTTSKH